ncbi:MAG: GlcG/HbpS family heme-binding protein, partial [Paracraurococcus sp.]
ACQANGHRVVAVVVDRYGHVLTVMRDEAARPHAIEIATRKAYTSAMLGYETAKLAANIANGTTPASITQTSGFTGLIGGMPIKLENEVVGGIGVSGAPGGQLDEACAVAAMKAVPLTN